MATLDFCYVRPKNRILSFLSHGHFEFLCSIQPNLILIDTALLDTPLQGSLDG